MKQGKVAFEPSWAEEEELRSLEEAGVNKVYVRRTPYPFTSTILCIIVWECAKVAKSIIHHKFGFLCTWKSTWLCTIVGGNWTLMRGSSSPLIMESEIDFGSRGKLSFYLNMLVWTLYCHFCIDFSFKLAYYDHPNYIQGFISLNSLSFS